MPGALLVAWKEWLLMRRTRRLLLWVPLKAVIFGVMFPALSYLTAAGILDLGSRGIPVTSTMRDTITHLTLGTMYPMFLPFLLSVTVFAVASHSVSEEAQRRTLERLLALPLAWREIVVGKVAAYVALGAAFGILMWSVYWVMTGLVAPGVPTAGRVAQSGLLMAVAAWYTPAAAVAASAYGGTARGAAAIGGLLTYGVFLGVFFVSRALRVGPGSEFAAISGVFLVAAGIVFLLLTMRLNPERLLASGAAA
jgi:ABC-type Na+ efflux pump permease subunit